MIHYYGMRIKSKSLNQHSQGGTNMSKECVITGRKARTGNHAPTQ